MKSYIATIVAGFLSSVMLLTSCTSSGQAVAGLTGAAIGSNIGGAIGGVSGRGYYHYNGQGAALGSLIGMGVGAALGVAIQKSVENNERSYYEGYQDNNSYSSSYNTPAPVQPRLPLSISEITYFDGNGDGYMSKGETIEVETYIKNTGNRTLYNLYITLDTQNSKYVTVSSPLTISLEPGQKVRYSGRIYCRRIRHGHDVPLTITLASGSSVIQSETLYLGMR